MSQALAQGHRAAGFHPALGAAFGAPDSEGRQHQRARARWPIRVVGAGDAIVSGWVSDVSEGGFGLMSRVNSPVGTLLETAFAIPHPKDSRRSLSVRAKVRVVSSSFCGTESRLGVQFMSLPMEARVAIRNYTLSHS